MTPNQNLQAIGIVRSCFGEKFGTPRQPGLVPAATAILELLPPYDDPLAFVGIDGVSHVWLIFGFHQVRSREWRPQVRPPRLGGNARLGVFATRSTHRPNGLGLSVVRLQSLEMVGGRVRLLLEGADLIDGTPVYDIKPYIPYSDQIADASNAVASAPPGRIPVKFTEDALADIRRLEQSGHEQLRALIEQTLALDPAPAYHSRTVSREYGVLLTGVNVRWRYAQTAGGTSIHVLGLMSATPS